MSPRVSSYMSTPVIAVEPSDNLAHVRNLMIKYRIGRVIVINEDGRPIGMITKKSLMKAMIRKGLITKPLETILVFQVLSKISQTVRPSQSIIKAAKKMVKYKISGLPVVNEDNKLVGIITKTNIVRAFSERFIGKMEVNEIMEREFLKVTPMHTVFYVVNLIISNPLGKVLVKDNGRVVGIIAESDIISLSYSYPSVLKVKYRKKTGVSPRGVLSVTREHVVPIAQDIMTPNPITVLEEEDASIATRLMILHNISSLPVVDREDEAKGIITKMNIVSGIIKIRGK